MVLLSGLHVYGAGVGCVGGGGGGQGDDFLLTIGNPVIWCIGRGHKPQKIQCAKRCCMALCLRLVKNDLNLSMHHRQLIPR